MKGVYIKCICGLDVYRYPSRTRLGNSKFCSKACFHKSLLLSDDLICKQCNLKYHRAPSQIKLRGSSFCSNKCKGLYYKKSKSGSNSNFWNGGISIENKRIRAGSDFRQWRESVFERDNYTCQMCGIRGGYLEADHIKPFAYFPELRFILSNGRTLCKKCHKLTDTYMGKAKKYENKS